MSRGVSEKDTPCSVGRISRRRNPPTAAPEQPSGGLRFANPPYALKLLGDSSQQKISVDKLMLAHASYAELVNSISALKDELESAAKKEAKAPAATRPESSAKNRSRNRPAKARHQKTTKN